MAWIGGTLVTVGLAAGFQWVALWFTKRSHPSAHWFALVLAFVGGLFLWAAPLAQKALHWSWFQQYLWFLPVLGALVLVGILIYDVGVDRRPDRSGVMATFLIPLVLVAAITVFPKLWGEVGGKAHDWGNTVSSTTQER